MMLSKKKIALIGASAVGKSSCAQQFEEVAGASSMDKKFGKVAPSLEAAVAWIVSGTSEVVVDVSAHEDLLFELYDHRRNRVTKPVDLKDILFVHLYCPVPGIRLQRLRQSGRREGALPEAIAWDELVNNMCHTIADVSINTADMSLDEVQQTISSLRSVWVG